MWRVHWWARNVAVATSILIVVAGCGPSSEPGTPSQDLSTAESGAGELGAAAQPAQVTFERPEGFDETSDYHIIVPLYPGGVSQWIVPAGGQGGLDVIAVTSYLLDRDVSRASDRELKALVDGYARQVQAESASDPVRSTVAGHPALTQDIRQPGPFNYQTTFVFAGPYLVQVMCQHDQQRAAVARGCTAVLDTLRLALA